MNCQLKKCQVDQLTEKYGSPLYVFHEEEFKANYLELLSSFRKIYPKYNIAYSYKTNYTPGICRLVKELGGLAEVVSDMEYRLAKKIGYENKKIIYNGPIKGEGVYEHLLAGGVANIDNLDEMRDVILFAKEHPNCMIRLAFRVNIDIGQGFISRFGLDAYEEEREGSELETAFQMAKKEKNICIVGLHCHVGRSRSVEAWKNRVQIMFKLVDRHFAETLPEFIDFGSGMNSVMEPELAKQFSGHVPSFGEYVDIVAVAMKEKYGELPIEDQPMLYTEPGTTVVSGTISFLGTVKSIKNVKEKTYITFDCSSGNMGDICHLKQLPITVYHNGHKKVKCENAVFVGYTCLEHDHIYNDFNGEIAIGDIVQFRNVGSYSNVFKPPFILPNCAMVQINNKGETKVLKCKETMDDIFSTYVF